MREENPFEKVTEGIEGAAERIKDKATPFVGELRHDRFQQTAGFVLLGVVLIAAMLLVLPWGRPMVRPEESPPYASPSPITTESLSAATPAAPATFLAGRSVIIDAGHGGFDPGAVGLEKTEEAPLNLEMAKRLQSELESRGARVIMTRTDENALAGNKHGDMSERNRVYLESGADIGISIHMNKYKESNVSGPMVFYYPNSAEGQRLAQCVQDTLCAALERKSRVAKSANYFMLRESKTTSILVECGFLSNPDDVYLLKKESHQKKLASAIADGLEAYFALPPLPTPPPSPSSEPLAEPTWNELCPGLDEAALDPLLLDAIE